MAENRRVLTFSDGSAKFADPDLYFPPGRDRQRQQQHRVAGPGGGSNTPDPVIVKTFQVALAAAMTTAAARSGRPR